MEPKIVPMQRRTRFWLATLGALSFWLGAAHAWAQAYLDESLTAQEMIEQAASLRDQGRIPDAITLPWVIGVPLVALALPQIQGGELASTFAAARASGLSPHLAAYVASVIGGLGGALFAWLPARLCRVLGIERAMGRGDVKFLMAIGLLLGLERTWLVMFSASVLAALAVLALHATRREKAVVFGPFLAVALLAMLVFRPA